MIEPVSDETLRIWNDPDAMLEEWENSENKKHHEGMVAKWCINSQYGWVNGPVADLGCGNGRLAQVLDVTSVNYFGFDASQVMIDRARERCPVHSFTLVDIFNYSSDRKYDTVILHDVAYHQNNPIEAVIKVMQLWEAEQYIYSLLVGNVREELLVSVVEPLSSLFVLLDKVELENMHMKRCGEENFAWVLIKSSGL